mgnify:CR=1 FL=1
MTTNIVSDNKESVDVPYNNIQSENFSKDSVITINLKQLKRKLPEELQRNQTAI